MFHSRICKMLAIEYPLLQGAMAWIAGGRLAAAVSEAGAMGVIGTGSMNAQWLKEQIHIARSLSKKPFAVNLMLTSSYVDEIVQLIIKEKISAVTTGGGNPGPYINALKNAGIKVMPVVASVALAKRLERLGVDALIAEGMESGGHIGEMTTMCLVPMIADAVKVPVIAAGGIADGRGFMAAMALGAEGVQVGTRFICAAECDVHQAYQEKVLSARDRATRVCGTRTGHPVRALHNKFTRQYLEEELKGCSKNYLEELGRGRYPSAARSGQIEDGSVLAGQIAGLVNKVQPAAEIVNEIINDAAKVKERLEGI
jgi:enoyl-[acyl-carrier protein] reductase II